MRRPLSFIFLSFAIGIALVHYIKAYMAIVVVFLISTLLAAFVSKKRILYLVALFLFLGSIYSDYELNKLTLQREQEGESLGVYGNIIGLQSYSSDFHKLNLNTEDYGNILINYSGLLPNENIIGKKIKVRGIVKFPSPARNPNCFNQEMHFKTLKTSFILDTENIDFVSNAMSMKASYLHAIAEIKYNFLEVGRLYLSEDNLSILKGMLFGDKTSMDEDIYELFQENGIAHILSVSGIHLGILYGFIMIFFKKRMNLPIGLFTIFFLLSYAAFAEFSPSAVRAVIMIIIHIISKLSRMRYDLLTAICLTAFIILIYNPLNLFNIGFQLSFSAVFVLAFLLPFFKRLKYKIKDNILTLLVIQIGMQPLTAYYFNYFSLSSFILNIPVIALAGLIIPIGIIEIFLSYISDFLFIIFARASGILINIMKELSFFADSIPFNSMTVRSPEPIFIVVFYIILFGLSSESFRILYQRKMYRPIMLILTIFLLSSIVIYPLLPSSDASDIVFVDVGQGDCIHVRTPNGKNILIDGGGHVAFNGNEYNVGKKILKPYLLKNGVMKVDLALATHLHADHFKGLCELSQEIEISSLGIYGGNKYFEEEIRKDFKTGKINYLCQGDKIAIEKDIWVEVIYPELDDEINYDSKNNQEDENANSLVFKLLYKGLSILITGDLGFEGEELINSEKLDADILKVGHHGSRFSTGDSFLENVNPKIAVIQVGKNTYGHPSPELIEKCEKSGIIIYRNDLDGAVMIENNKIRKMIE